MLQDEMASVPPHPPTLVDQSTSETLERHRHSLQLSPRVPSSLCLCLAVMGLDSVRKEKCTCECSKITPIPLLSETTKREWFLSSAHVGKHSYCSAFQKFSISPNLLRHVGGEFHSLRGIQDQITLLFVLETSSDMREAVHHCQEATTLHSLVFLWKTGS